MGVILRAHSVRGEPRLQRKASGEVVTLHPVQCRGKAANYPPVGGAPTIRRGPTMYIVLVS